MLRRFARATRQNAPLTASMVRYFSMELQSKLPVRCSACHGMEVDDAHIEPCTHISQ